MAEPPPVPAASQPVSPPLNKMPFTDPKTGMLTLLGISFLTQFWAAVIGDGGLGPAIAKLQEQVSLLEAEVTIIFNMHGDGTLSADGILIVTKTDGVPFGYFATGTDAAHLSGILDPARIADETLPYIKLVDTSTPALLGAAGSGPVTEIEVGDGLQFAGETLEFDPDTVPAGTIPFSTLENTTGAALLGAGAAGPIVQITLGPGLAIVAGVLVSTFTGPAAVAVAALGAATATKRAFVNDSSIVAAGNFGNVVAGGGANFCPVWADGANWRIG